MGLEVVDANGSHLPITRSLLRYAILGTPYYLNCWLGMSAFSPNSWAVGLLSFLVFGWGGAILYLYAFNRRTRQSVHDLAVGSYVVQRAPAGAVNAPPIWRGHFAVIGAGMVVVLLLAVFARFTIGVPLFAKMVAVRQALIDSGEVRNASVMEGANWLYTTGGSGKSTNYSVQAFMKIIPDDAEAEKKKIAAIALSHLPDAMQKDFLVINTTYAINLGLASWSYSDRESHSPAEWKKILAGTPGT